MHGSGILHCLSSTKYKTTTKFQGINFFWFQALFSCVNANSVFKNKTLALQLFQNTVCLVLAITFTVFYYRLSLYSQIYVGSVLWFNPGWQLSPTQPLTDFCPVRWGRESEG